MNDFFHVLDDFELEDFAPAGEPDGESAFSLDVEGDSSSIDVGEAELDQVNDYEERNKITEANVDEYKAEDGNVYVWNADGNPFSSTASEAGEEVKVAGVVLGLVDVNFETNANGISVGIVEIKNVDTVTFTSSYKTENLLVIKDTDVGISGTADAVIDLDNGNVTGGFFRSGSGTVTVQSDVTANNEDIYNTSDNKFTLTVDGKEVPETAEEAPSYVADNSNLKSVTTKKLAGTTVAISGDYNVDVDENTIKIRNVADGTYVVKYTADGTATDIVLDLSDLSATNGSVLTVVEAEDVDQLIPPATTGTGSIRIVDETTTYKYTTSGKAYFTLEGDKVEGFVFIGNNDSITLDGKTSINFYDEDVDDKLPLKVENNKGEYTVKYDGNDYAIAVSGSAKVTIGEGTAAKTFDFNNKSGATVTINFAEDGKIESVDGLYNLTDKDQVTVTGFTAESATDGLPVYNAAGTKQYISTSGDSFTLIGGAQQLQVEPGETVYAAYTPVKQLAAETGVGNITDEINDITYSYGGEKGYFVYDNAKGITGFVFKSKDDFVTLPDGDGEKIDLYYDSVAAANKITVPVNVDTTEGFKVTLSDLSDKTAPKFLVSDLSEGASINAAILDKAFITEDNDDEITIDLAGNIKGINNLDTDITLVGGNQTIDVNGDTFIYGIDTVNAITVTGDNGNLAKVTGLDDDDVVSSSNSLTTFVFDTDSTDGDALDILTVNDKTYSITGDNNNVSITAGGVVDGLDVGASLKASEGPITVNGSEYSKEDVATGEAIVGFTKKNRELGSYIEDSNHPLFTDNTTTDDLLSDKWLGLTFTDDQRFRESTVEDPATDLDRSADSLPAEVIFDTKGDHASKFNDVGKNVAIVTEDAEGTKDIVLGNHGDAVIMMGTSEYGEVNISLGAGNDTVFVGGATANDKVLLDANMKTNINFSGSSGVDKIHTYAAANANIVLQNYDAVNTNSGIVVHDPEVPYIKNLVEAIDDGLLVFDDDGVTAIDRDEEYNGNDRKTRITLADADQNMIRLFGYKDNRDEYGDDFGQLVGWTDKEDEVLDASTIKEDLVLVGNNNGNKNGASLKTGAGDDTVLAGGNDTIDTGDGKDLIVLDKTEGRDSATIIVGKGAGDAVLNVQSGFDGDVFDVTAFDGKLDYAFEDGELIIVDKSSKSTLYADTDEKGSAIKQTFINGTETLYAAIAQEEGKITVTDDDDTVPNYYLAKGGAIDFSGFSGEVHMDVDGEDTDWSGPNQVGDTSNVTIGSSVSSLIGGSGTTIFKGGKGNETLVAGTAESSIYGGGGKNVLVGQSGNENKVGSTEFFNIGIHNGAQNTIKNFEFIEDGGANQATFDNLNLGLSDGNEVTAIETDAEGNVSIAIKGAESGAIEKVTIEKAAGNEFLVDRGTEFETVAQIAAKEVTVNNSYVDFYCATDDKDGATVKVGDIDATEIWLDAPDYGNGVDFSNSRFTVVDASDSAAEVLIAGNNLNNTIIAGSGSASMWGGSGGDDVLIAGTGHNEFYFEAYNGNDTILGAKDGDVIQLGVNLDQIDFDNTNVVANGVEIKLTDGSSLTVVGNGNVDIVLDDGTTAKVNHQTQSFE